MASAILIFLKLNSVMWTCSVPDFTKLCQEMDADHSTKIHLLLQAGVSCFVDEHGLLPEC